MERKTIASTHIWNLFKTSKSPVTFHEIDRYLKQKQVAPNKSTIYRILDKLLNNHKISQITTKEGKSYYELQSHSHHHHFICNSCHKAFCLKSCHIDSQKINLSQLLPNAKFSIDSHDFNLYGVCDSCSV
ncbi:hypothetical protein DID77_00705 [Candidatus Marinamargulisbacteria bacterium SCGC AG-439-L15]|nr:hypothetical protein DID77_00705 [Candidatus Marinamargulisbacteria bacterium SCGC AG-439-L15]